MPGGISCLYYNNRAIIACNKANVRKIHPNFVFNNHKYYTSSPNTKPKTCYYSESHKITYNTQEMPLIRY